MEFVVWRTVAVALRHSDRVHGRKNRPGNAVVPEADILGDSCGIRNIESNLADPRTWPQIVQINALQQPPTLAKHDCPGFLCTLPNHWQLAAGLCLRIPSD